MDKINGSNAAAIVSGIQDESILVDVVAAATVNQIISPKPGIYTGNSLEIFTHTTPLNLINS